MRGAGQRQQRNQRAFPFGPETPENLAMCRATCQARDMFRGATPRSSAGVNEPNVARSSETPTRGAAASPAILAIQIAPPTQSLRGALQAYVELALEQRLEQLGACARPAYVEATREAIISDQLYRVRMLGFEELQVTLGSLAELSLNGLLTLEDSETLSFWQRMQCTRSEFSLCLDACDSLLSAHPAPVRLDSGWPALFQTPALPLQEAEVKALVHEAPANFSAPKLTAVVERPSDSVSTAPAEQPVSSADSVPSEGAVVRALRPFVHGDVGAGNSALSHEEMELMAPNAQKSSEVRNNVVSFRHAMRGLLRDEPPALAGVGPLAPESRVATPSSDAGANPSAHLLETLRDANGGQSYESLETLFADCYLPLRQSMLDGNAPPGCAPVLSSFSSDFARSYARAFEALRTRGKRPTMVLDAPNLAFRLARQHAAPKHTLLLVDALRFDVGVAAEERLHLQLLGHASCVARGKLWSALPADTATQLELIARGAEGLRQLNGGVAESQVMSPPGDARKARSMRVGPHHLFKLDVVQHFVNQQDGLLTAQRLAQAAADVAVSVGRFIKAQTPGTLVFVFGDHGFNADRSLEPSPELVLVPYQAWLVRAPQADTGRA
jgi:hypothetical protein